MPSRNNFRRQPNAWRQGNVQRRPNVQHQTSARHPQTNGQQQLNMQQRHNFVNVFTAAPPWHRIIDPGQIHYRDPRDNESHTHEAIITHSRTCQSLMNQPHDQAIVIESWHMCGRWNDNNADPKLHLTVEFYFGQTKLGRWHVYPFGMQFNGRLTFIDLSRLGAGASIIAMAMGKSELDHNWRTQPAPMIFNPFEGYNDPNLGRNHVFRPRDERDKLHRNTDPAHPQDYHPHAAQDQARGARGRHHEPQHRSHGGCSDADRSSFSSLTSQDEQDFERVQNRTRLRTAIGDPNVVGDYDPEEVLSVISKHTGSIAEWAELVGQYSHIVSRHDEASHRDIASRYSPSVYDKSNAGSEHGGVATVYAVELDRHDATSRSSQSVYGHDNSDSESGGAALEHRAISRGCGGASHFSRSEHSYDDLGSEYAGAASEHRSGQSEHNAGRRYSQSVYGHDNANSGYGISASDYGPGASQYSIAATKASSFITNTSLSRVMPGYGQFKSARRLNNHVGNWLQRIEKEVEEEHIRKTHVDEPPVSAAYLAYVASNEIGYESDTMSSSRTGSGNDHESEYVSKGGNMEQHQEHSQIADDDYDYELDTASIHP